MTAKVCATCGQVFEAKRSTAKYCSDRCRKKAYKASMRQPVVPAGKPAPIPSATFDDVAAALDGARSLSNRFAQLSTSAPRPLRPGCARISQAITRAIKDEEW